MFPPLLLTAVDFIEFTETSPLRANKTTVPALAVPLAEASMLTLAVPEILFEASIAMVPAVAPAPDAVVLIEPVSEMLPAWLLTMMPPEFPAGDDVCIKPRFNVAAFAAVMAIEPELPVRFVVKICNGGGEPLARLSDMLEVGRVNPFEASAKTDDPARNVIGPETEIP